MQTSLQRIHPLVAAAAVSIILVSMLGVATITGVLPQSNSQTTAVGLHGAIAAKPALSGASMALGNLQPGVTTPAAYLVASAAPGQAGAGARPLSVRETLTPGETLITLPSGPAMPSATTAPGVVVVPAPARPTGLPSPAAPASAVPVALMPATRDDAATRTAAGSASTLRMDGRLAVNAPTTHTSSARAHDRTGLRSAESVASGDDASSAPVIRESRRRMASGPQVVAPMDAPASEALPAQRIVPVYRDQRTRQTSVTRPGAVNAAAGIEPVSPPYPQDVGTDGPATRFGTTLGRSLGDGIDRTISAIADVLSAVAAAPPSSPRNAADGLLPGER